MLKSSRLISLSLLTVSLFFCGFSKPTEARSVNIDIQDLTSRRGGTSTLGDTNQVTLIYSFSLFDVTPDGPELNGVCELDEQDVFSSCLFENAVSDLSIDYLSFTLQTINGFRIGTDSDLENSIELVPIVNEDGLSDTLNLALDLESLPKFLNLRSEWDSDTNGVLYSFTSPSDKLEPIQFEVFSESETFREFDLGFQLVAPDNEPLHPELRSSLVSNPGFILDTLNTLPEDGDVDFEVYNVTTPSGVSLTFDLLGEPGDPTVSFNEITDSADIPEPTAAVGLLLFPFLGIKFTKKQVP